MIEDTLTTAIAKITVKLLALTENTISGAILGEMIPVVTPELRVREVMNIPTGPGALRKFIDLHLKHVLIPSHKQGSDVIYSIVGSTSPKSENVDPDLWRTFVRTNSSKTLVLHGAALQIEEVNGAVHDDAKLISSATTDELNQIRIDFIKSLGEMATGLPDMKAPYADWSAALRKLGREHYRNWTEYRLRKIEELFGSRLDALEIESSIRSNLCSQIRRSQFSTKEHVGVNKQPYSLQKISNNDVIIRSVEPDDVKFRQAVLEVLKEFSTSELRAIMLPAGALADALSRQYAK